MFVREVPPRAVVAAPGPTRETDRSPLPERDRVREGGWGDGDPAEV